jgi:hypothetical protein
MPLFRPVACVLVIRGCALLRLQAPEFVSARHDIAL